MFVQVEVIQHGVILLLPGQLPWPGTVRPHSQRLSWGGTGRRETLAAEGLGQHPVALQLLKSVL